MCVCVHVHILLVETIVRQSSFDVAFAIVIVACTSTRRLFFCSRCRCFSRFLCDLHVFGYTVNTLDLCTITTLVIIFSVQTLQCLCEEKKNYQEFNVLINIYVFAYVHNIHV